MPAPFDLKTLLSDPQTLAFDAAGFDLQQEFMTEAVVHTVPATFDRTRAGKHLRDSLGPDYARGLRFVIVPNRQGDVPLVPLVVAFNRPMPLADMVENLTKMVEAETRLSGGDPDICLRKFVPSREGFFNRLLAAGKIRKTDGP